MIRIFWELKTGTGSNGNGYRGVKKYDRNKFEARGYHDYRSYHIGVFSTAEEAALAIARKKQDM